MAKWLQCLLDRLAGAMTTQVELPLLDGRGKRTVWMAVATDSGVVWLEAAVVDSEHSSSTQRESAANLLVPLAG